MGISAFLFAIAPGFTRQAENLGPVSGNQRFPAITPGTEFVEGSLTGLRQTPAQEKIGRSRIRHRRAG